MVAPHSQRSASRVSDTMKAWLRGEVNGAITLLAETYPKCFVIHEARRRPLKIGINADLVAALAGVVEPRMLGLALKIYTSNVVYLTRLL